MRPLDGDMWMTTVIMVPDVSCFATLAPGSVLEIVGSKRPSAKASVQAIGLSVYFYPKDTLCSITEAELAFHLIYAYGRPSLQSTSYAFRRGAQDCRITNEVASSTRSDFSGSPAICWNKRSTAIEPISLNGWRIVVSGGLIHSADGMSSKPMMLMSCGTCIPCSERAR